MLQNSEPYKILVVDDDSGMRELLELLLLKHGYHVRCAESGSSAIEAIRNDSPDLVVTDIRMQPVNGLEVLKKCKTISPRTIVIMISAYASTELAVEAMNEGAYDYFPKPFNNDELLSVISIALHNRGNEQPVSDSREGPLYFGGMIGESAPMLKVYETVQRVANIGSNVVITGESGTGKELVARAIHRQSARRDQPLVIVNCGGVPENLVESELFGYRKGAFTGAAADRKGLVEAARGGTLFLDEIGELTPILQVKLLRLVQDKTIKMIGGTEEIPVDVRIISATNRDLEHMVMEKTFREDLYYRLNVLHIRVPPLRHRRGDIPLLARYFLAKFTKDFGKDIHKVSSYAMDILCNYEFPGNVRELEHIIERGVAMESSRIILPDSLTLSLHRRKQQERTTLPEICEIPAKNFELDKHIAEIESRLLQQALNQTGGIKLKAAKLLGISFRSFRYRLLKYELATEDELKEG
ncbi:MAG: sigma-54 dependent transcriptional regulator [Syntrophobacteraceae bacterium]|nr:sigma-54 dependent transcriptional regulator [Syntrophobacteraceae bacterium]